MLVPRGLRYQTGIPKVRLGRWRVAMIGEEVTLEGGHKKGMLMNCPMVGDRDLLWVVSWGRKLAILPR